MTTTEAALRQVLANAGWRVAVHNDYRLNGEDHTFWLFTHPNGRWIKGEGRSDAEALAECAAALSQPSPASSTDLRDIPEMPGERVAAKAVETKLIDMFPEWDGDQRECIAAILAEAALSPSGELASVAGEEIAEMAADFMRKHWNNPYAPDHLRDKIVAALSKPTPVEAGALRLAKEALDLAHPYIADAVKADGGIDACDIAYRMDLEKVEAASAAVLAALSETLPVEREGGQ